MRRFAAALVPASIWLLALGGCGDSSPDLALVGTVERTQVELVAPVSERILRLEARRGERVEPGQVVARLDPTLALAELASAEASLAGARVGSVVRGLEYERSQRLHAQRVIAEQELDRAQLTRDEAAARHWAAEAQVSAARRRVADHILVAPVAGVVDQLPFDEGERVPAGAVLAVIVDEGAPWVRVWMPERAYGRVGPGTEAEVRVDGLTAPLRGRVDEIAREPEFTPYYALTERERVHLVYETRVAIEGAPADLRAGAPASVAIRLPDQSELARR